MENTWLENVDKLIEQAKSWKQHLEAVKSLKVGEVFLFEVDERGFAAIRLDDLQKLRDGNKSPEPHAENFDPNRLHLVGKDIIESHGYIGDHEDDAATCYQAAKEIERLRQALSVYAKKEVYSNDEGKTAREALGGGDAR